MPCGVPAREPTRCPSKIPEYENQRIREYENQRIREYENRVWGVPRCPVVCHLASLFCAGRAKSMGYRDALGCWGAFFRHLHHFFCHVAGRVPQGVPSRVYSMPNCLNCLDCLPCALRCPVVCPPLESQLDAWMPGCALVEFTHSEVSKGLY